MPQCEKYTKVGKRSFTSQKSSGKKQSYSVKISWNKENCVFNFTLIGFVDRRKKK